ncbi:isochorismatase family protein [Consotaella salsifontis]|uniref:Nicotinamidase-related amidase n=1 Tax=Consotaella salsifontis TaxID=1365950 RepID=A0A1T4QJ47_9HYPH|nr:isochorismatase family protein [Consotaella salsifontis]SKA03712.1 Nicotinamidase-related amidase [Consotaella salsifontis]
MAITSLDARTALIVIDLQKGILPMVPAALGAEIVSKVASLAAAFRARQLPVVFVNVAGGAPGRTEQPRPGGDLPADWTELVPELGVAAEDIRVTKHSWGAFTATGLAEMLKECGVTHVVICGIATSIGVETTARQAYELGFNVALAVDAMTDRIAEAHENSLKRIFPRLGETGTCAAIIAALEGRESGKSAGDGGRSC